MQTHGPDTIQRRALQAIPHHFIDDTRLLDNAEDVDMAEDALGAIRAYKSETDCLLVDTYAVLAGEDFDVRKASAPVQARWMRASLPKRL